MPRQPKAPIPIKNQGSSKPAATNAVLQAAFAAHQAGRFAEAQDGYMQVLAADSRHADALHLLGVVHLQKGRLAEAETQMRKALAVREDPVFFCNLGHLLQGSTRVAEAEASYRRALQLKPDHVDAHYNLGILLKNSNRPAEAEAAYRQALKLKPDHAEAHNNLGALLSEKKCMPEAEAAYRRALEFKPDHVDAHNNLGILLKNSHRLAEAEATYRHALTLRPDHAGTHYNLGDLLYKAGRLAEAEAAYRRTLELKPDYAEAHNNLGALLYGRKCMPEAEAAYRRALEFKPDDAEARLNLSILLLTLQRFDEAWPLHESRYELQKKERHGSMPSLAFPQWQGQSLAGKSLVIWPEQGFGDYIQFARYAPLLKELGVARLTLACRQPLAALLETVEGVDAVVTDLDAVPVHDYWSFGMSLPLHCRTTAQTIPVKPMPYMHALPARMAQWKDRLPVAGLKVGLVWKGNPGHGNDANRSLPGLASLAPLWDVEDVTFVSLQKGQGEEEALQPPAGQPLVALGTGVSDFADMAAIVSQLDLVICVDTAMAHLAGALGKPCWVLLSAVGTDWRWQLDRTDSPWYPAIRLFRQTDSQDWRLTIAEVADALKAWASSQGNNKPETHTLSP